jgi:CubicO group peptidase (beta-lactamase class C family)
MRRKFRSFVVVSVLLGSLIFPFAPSGSLFSVRAQKTAGKTNGYAARLGAFEDFVRRQMKLDGTIGMTIGFIKDDYTWVKAFGYSDFENRIPAKPESMYRLASITKTMTSIAVLQLVEQGKIDLDAEVQKYVPYFPKKKFPVTVRQLLGHLGGVSAYKTPAEERFKEHKNTRESVAVFADFDLVAEPGTKFSYSSYGYILLGAVIESASGKSYGDYLRENVWNPLGMRDIRMEDPLDIIPNRVRGYQLINGKLKNSEFVDISSRFASGGTRSTVTDLLKLARGMSAGKLLSPQTRDLMWTPQATGSGRFTNYGMGWWTDSSNGRFMVSHGGSQNETQTALLVFPAQNFAVAVAMNFENAIPYPYAQKLYEAILDEPWSINVYTKNEKDRLLLRGMDSAFDYGMRYLEQYDKPLTTDTKELGEAFSYFNRISDLPAQEAAEKVGAGRHPQAKQAFVKMVSFMAAKLRAGATKNGFKSYYRRGAIQLFADYVDWYRKNPSHPPELRFSEAFEKQLARWNADWAKIWNERTRKLQFTETTDSEKTRILLRDSFGGASVYPNFESELESLAGIYADRGEIKKALEIGEINVGLYPDSAQATGLLGIAYSVAGDKEKAVALFKKANELNPRAEASADSLNRFAYDLSSKGKVEAGLRLLETAIEIYPREANLYDSAGEFYMGLGKKEKAVEFYTKALEIDPNYSNAANAREILKKLKRE